MGVPALFRWLSRKYPKIIYPVIEENEREEDVAGSKIAVPVNMASPNPNGMEFDNLYLDMNGIIHPCTHPEGKPAPETEEEMMKEIFKYTERVVNMVRPRKLLFLAIDGVAPRAKMNQQRSRRFRAAQEAADKEAGKREAVALLEATGKEVPEEMREKKHWDTNAITPGTPFMELLANSLKYWITLKMNTDPGWRNIEVLLSDASVPGEGEHKIMDFIRRQRSNPGHDPNTRHVIYGLDADLIMLALATHEPHFKVLREDVFGSAKPGNACRICGQEGHYAAQCTGVAPPKSDEPPEKKPFIFLDVAILREYLEVELNISNLPFPFDFERAIDDWVLLIFFVGNDFLPHLPSLEIREGAIDTLLKIWKQELARMGGYMTNHGELVLKSAQIILEGVALREPEIFRKRHENEERQEYESKRRKIEREGGKVPTVSTAASSTSKSHTLPAKPDFAANANALGLGASQGNDVAAAALGGSNRDVVKNRAAIRLANMSAAESLKAELASLVPVKKDVKNAAVITKSPSPSPPPPPVKVTADPTDDDDDLEIPGFGVVRSASDVKPLAPTMSSATVDSNMSISETQTSSQQHDTEPASQETNRDFIEEDDLVPPSPRGAKRGIDEIEADTSNALEEEDDEGEDDNTLPSSTKTMVVNPDGTVDQEDTVKLYEPGYRERYYRQKFAVELSDSAFRKAITLSYVEGLAWVLQYYYQGAPSWQWYYPYHFAPFAEDFEDVGDMKIEFTLGAPFRPYEQLMGVFPAASRQSIPSPFHPLMVDEDSPIIDFYPSTFEIDMNGKKMSWQGVALLPFIDPKRLLDAMALYYPQLSDEQLKRNEPGNSFMLVCDEHSLYAQFESLYGRKKQSEPTTLDVNLSKGVNGFVQPNPDCIPGSTYYSPLESATDLPDLKNDRSLSAFYYYPNQLTPHRSVLLPGVAPPPKILDWNDTHPDRRQSGRGRGRGGMDRGPRNGHGGDRNGPPRNGMAPRNQYNESRNAAPNYSNANAMGGYNQNYPRQPAAARGGYQGGGGYGGYPAAAGVGDYGGYGNRTGYNAAAPPRPPPAQAQYGGYGGYSSAGGYGMTGDYGAQRPAYNGQGPPNINYGGYGGYQANPPPLQNNRGGYGNGAPNGGRGRGRGGPYY